MARHCPGTDSKARKEGEGGGGEYTNKWQWREALMEEKSRNEEVVAIKRN